MPMKGVKRNIVLISMDDAIAFWKYRSIFGETLQTPNLDRICEQSTAFHSAYCQAPICSPSRASFMSGKPPHETGVTGTDKNYFDKIDPESMWPYILKQNGYFCSSGGKVMRGFVPLPKHIHNTIYSDRRRRFNVGMRNRNFEGTQAPDGIERMEFGGYRGGEATIHEKDDNSFYDYGVARSVEMFLKRYTLDTPFYREVGFTGTHGPWKTPRRFKEMYNVKNIRKPDEWKNGFDENAFIDKECQPNIDNSNFRFWRESVRNYFSAMTHVDHHLGKVWDAIKSSRHAANTVIIILSDHGLHLGERNRFRKHTLWEQVANVPLIIHDPDQPDGQVIDDPVALLDLGPTVMDYLDLPPLEGCIGRSLRPLMNGGRDPERPVLTVFHDSTGMRKENYRFIRYADGSTQFFDLHSDWWQTRDLGSDHPDFARMSRHHAECCKDYKFNVNAAKAALNAPYLPKRH